VKWKGTDYYSLSDFRTATGQETVNSADTGFCEDPKLYSAGAEPTIGDTSLLPGLTCYMLKDDSPLINAGLDINTLFTEHLSGMYCCNNCRAANVVAVRFICIGSMAKKIVLSI